MILYYYQYDHFGILNDSCDSHGWVTSEISICLNISVFLEIIKFNALNVRVSFDAFKINTKQNF
jgi:hypothetical protein